MPADSLVQLRRGGAGLDAEFAREGLRADAVLHQGEMRQALPAVAAHKPAVRTFPAGVGLDYALA